jgi:hypothetical protein
MTKETYIGNCINTICNTNIYENKRTQEIVDYRSLFCYILNKDLKLTLHKIKDHLNINGKKMNHATVLHNVRLFEDVRKRKPKLHDLRFEIMGSIDPKYLLLKRIENIKDQEKIEQITNCVNHYE